jgi:heme-degrading monooxygenase HmoA
VLSAGDDTTRLGWFSDDATRGLTNYVIIRTTTTVVPEPRLNEYLEDVQAQEIATYENTPGFVSVWVIRRLCVTYVELMTISLWVSEQALDQFVESQKSEDRETIAYGAFRLDARIYELAMFREVKGAEN